MHFGVFLGGTLVFSLDIRCTSACHENTFCPQLTFAGLSARPWVSLRGRKAVVRRPTDTEGIPSPQGGAPSPAVAEAHRSRTPLATRQPLTPSFPWNGGQGGSSFSWSQEPWSPSSAGCVRPFEMVSFFLPDLANIPSAQQNLFQRQHIT